MPDSAPERAGFDATGVRDHYARLAPRYAERANVACSRAYAALVRRVLGASCSVMEVGAGSSSLLSELPARRRVACDLSHPMLAAQREPTSWARVAADAQTMPFRDASFDGVYAINVIEHVPNQVRLMNEAARVLAPGGLFVVVTPNGDVEWMLDLLEHFRMKLPEGPHQFLGAADLAGLAGLEFNVVELRRFLAFPAGPAGLVQIVDRLAGGTRGRGLFQYAVFERRRSIRPPEK